MRFLFILLVSSLGPAFACPELVGFYPTCKASNRNFEEIRDAEVIQSLRDGVTTFDLSYVKQRDEQTVKLKFRADGVAVRESQRIPDPSMTVTTVTTARCVGEALEIETDVSINLVPAGAFTTVVSKDQHQLVQKIQGRFWGQPVDSVVICE
jgi:hypothetical protein